MGRTGVAGYFFFFNGLACDIYMYIQISMESGALEGDLSSRKWAIFKCIFGIHQNDDILIVFFKYNWFIFILNDYLKSFGYWIFVYIYFY